MISFTDNLPNLICGGDTNIILNELLDRKSNVKYIKTDADHLFEIWLEERDLIDIWRVRNPELSRFTYRKRNRAGVTHSRLDRWLIDIHLQFIIQKVDILPSILSDHNPILLSLSICPENSQNRGFWKFNKSLLKDDEYVKKVKNLILQAKQNYADSNPAIFFDTLKAELRGLTIAYSSHISKSERAEEQRIIIEIKYLESQLIKQPELIDNYNFAKSRLYAIHLKRAEGHRIRARENKIDLDERPSKFFLDKEKTRGKTNNPGAMYKPNGDLTSDPKEILELQKNFYKELYTLRSTNNDCSEFFTKNLKKISDDDRELLCRLITDKEIGEALLSLPNNKAPGSDGFTSDFYKFFWPDIKDFVCASIKHAIATGSLSIEQKRGIINIIPKPDKDLRHIGNWRPLSLLNTDYKIFSKVLAKRLQLIIPKLINSDQTAYIKGRNLSDNIRTVWDLIEVSKLTKKSAYILFIDFEKAFDSVSFDFLLKCLKKCNLGSFVEHIKTLYNGINSCVSFKGSQSGYFAINRGVRQGDPLAAFLFLLVIESFSATIRENKTIKGLTIGKITKKISSYADDIALLISDQVSCVESIRILHLFEQASGLKMNLKKLKDSA